MTPTGPAWFSPYKALTDAARAQDWGTTDLFPTFSMPALPVLKLIPLPPRPLPSRAVVAPHMSPQKGLPKNM
ncbi:MAG TPA: hypothetical protein VIX90_16410 [Edaphobacter sp.]